VGLLYGQEATREKILRSLRTKLETLGEDASLLIYYAGHGQLDPLTDTGYWVPSNATLYDEDTWISFANIQTLLSAPGVEARHILVLTDSCYGGALARSGPTPGHKGPADESDVSYKQYRQRLGDLARKRSRQIIASGGYEQVPDRSDFADLLKQALKNNTYPAMDAELLFYKEVYPKLKFIGQQEPTISRFVRGPDVNGQFILVRQDLDTQQTEVNDKTEDPGEKKSDGVPETSARLTVRSNVSNDRVYIDGAHEGSTRVDKQMAPGTYTVRVEKEGYKTFEERTELAAGDKVVIQARLLQEAAPAPVVRLFAVDRQQITKGESVEVSWRAENAVTVEISSIGDLPLSGTRQVEPLETITYTLLAKNSAGQSVKMDVQVEVLIRTPNVLGKGTAEAERILSAERLRPGRVVRQHTGRNDGGTVIGQTPEHGTPVPQGSSVELTVEAELVKVASVIGQTLREARTTLSRQGLTVGKVSERSTGHTPGLILSQIPPAGEGTPPKTAIDLVIEAKIVMVAVPDLAGKPLTQARRELGDLDLKMKVRYQKTGKRKGLTVLRQKPAARASVKPGTTIALLVEEKEEIEVSPKPVPPVTKSCYNAVQDKIAWDYKGSKRWNSNNINRLCKGATNSDQPARCFDQVMHGGVNWGGGTKWQWSNAIDLCEGSKNARATVKCFKKKIAQDKSWKTAIASCDERSSQ
jgi:beta-lactam-binding protein with PASTA domain